MKEKKIDEGLEITVRETENEDVKRIKEFGFSLNTGQSGQAEFISPEFNGELEAIIVSSDKQIEIMISFEPFRDIVVYENVSFSGRKYLSLRVQPVHKDTLIVKNVSEKWVLNNGLWFIVNGPINATVNFIVRWS